MAELAQEGLDIAVLPIREAFKQTVTIFVDHQNKPVEDLEIEVPLVSDAVETTAELKGLAFEDVRRSFEQRYARLPIGKKKEEPIEYRERHLFTDEVVARMQLDAGLLANAWSAAGYFAQMLGRACRVSNPHAVLTPLIERFLSEVLFERKVDLYSGEVDHRMRDLDVAEHVKAIFAPLILAKTVRTKDRRRVSRGQRLSTWRPYQATSTDKRPAVPGQRTMFNLIPCENEFEQAFAGFLDVAGDVAAFAKNAGPQKLMIDYLRPDGHRAFYVPDFIVRLKNETYVLAELKGKTDLLVPLKAKAAIEWCKTAAGKTGWRYLYLPYLLFQRSAAATLEELARACEPALAALLEEADTGQRELPLAEASAQQEEAQAFVRACAEAGIREPLPEIEGAMRQAVALLAHAVRVRMPEFGHAFQPLLRPLDDYALRIFQKGLAPRIPAEARKREEYFSPYLDRVAARQRVHLDRYQRYLKDNLVYGRSIQKLATLLFCLSYAREGGHGVGGVWRDVAEVFADGEMQALYDDLDKVNSFRNTRVAHVETPLVQADEAWSAMCTWLRCLSKMAQMCR